MLIEGLISCELFREGSTLAGKTSMSSELASLVLLFVETLSNKACLHTSGIHFAFYIGGGEQCESWL